MIAGSPRFIERDAGNRGHDINTVWTYAKLNNQILLREVFDRYLQIGIANLLHGLTDAFCVFVRAVDEEVNIGRVAEIAVKCDRKSADY